MDRWRERLLTALAVLLVVGYLALQWFSLGGSGTTGTCDPVEDPVHCDQVTGPGPGDGR